MSIALDPSNCAASIGLSNGNLTATFTDPGGYGWALVYATQAFSSGQLYFEWSGTGVLGMTFWGAASDGTAFNMGSDTTGLLIDTVYNNVSFNNNSLSAVGPSVGTTDTFGIAMDFTNELVSAIDWTTWHTSASGGWSNSGSATYSSGIAKSISGLTATPWCPGVMFFWGGGSATTTVNFGATQWFGTMPAGFQSVYSASGGGANDDAAPHSGGAIEAVLLLRDRASGLLEPFRDLIQPKRPRLVPVFEF
jgi:hypothetical protein